MSFFRTNHSIPDSFRESPSNRLGYIIHTGDFKFDFTPLFKHTEYAKLTSYSEKACSRLLPTRPTPMSANLLYRKKDRRKHQKAIFGQIKGRIIISTFANVHRIQQIVEASVEHGRKIIVFGRSMEKPSTWPAVELHSGSPALSYSPGISAFAAEQNHDFEHGLPGRTFGGSPGSRTGPTGRSKSSPGTPLFFHPPRFPEIRKRLTAPSTNSIAPAAT